MHDKLDAKVNTIDASGLVKKNRLQYLITEIENKIPSISGLATKSALATVEDKIPNVCNLFQKQIMTQKLLKLKNKTY